MPTTGSRRWLTSGLPIVPQKSPAFRQLDFYSVSRKRMHKPVLYAHATVSLLPTTAWDPIEEIAMMFEPSPRMGSSWCTRKNGLRTFVAKRLSKSSAV